MYGDELFVRAVAALVREWGIDETEARAAIGRLRERERRLGYEVASEWTWTTTNERTAAEDRCDIA